ncbi:MAG: glycosyltransferase family 2 protein [Bacteroidales bacterium]
MKISIITATFNSSATISDCINSVNQQSYENIEHIIIDGASTDNTIEIINSIPNRIKMIISEPDKGIYDAMNKGIELATGDIIGILNSDDFYIDNTALKKIVDIFKSKNIDSLYTNLYIVAATDTNKIIRKCRYCKFNPELFKWGWHPPHPTFFVKKEVYQKYGDFNINLDVSADFELLLRFLYKNKISTFFWDEFILKMRNGGESMGSIKKILLGNKNVIKAFNLNNIRISKLYPFYRILLKLKQYI